MFLTLVLYVFDISSSRIAFSQRLYHLQIYICKLVTVRPTSAISWPRVPFVPLGHFQRSPRQSRRSRQPLSFNYVVRNGRGGGDGIKCHFNSAPPPFYFLLPHFFCTRTAAVIKFVINTVNFGLGSIKFETKQGFNW